MLFESLRYTESKKSKPTDSGSGAGNGGGCECTGEIHNIASLPWKSSYNRLYLLGGGGGRRFVETSKKCLHINRGDLVLLENKIKDTKRAQWGAHFV